jgi:hypothetical protein
MGLWPTHMPLHVGNPLKTPSCPIFFAQIFKISGASRRTGEKKVTEWSVRTPQKRIWWSVRTGGVRWARVSDGLRGGGVHAQGLGGDCCHVRVKKSYADVRVSSDHQRVPNETHPDASPEHLGGGLTWGLIGVNLVPCTPPKSHRRG